MGGPQAKAPTFPTIPSSKVIISMSSPCKFYRLLPDCRESSICGVKVAGEQAAIFFLWGVLKITEAGVDAATPRFSDFKQLFLTPSQQSS